MMGTADSGPRALFVIGSMSRNFQKQGPCSFYCKTVYHLLEKHTKDDIIAGTDADVMQFMQASNKVPTELSEDLSNKKL